VGQEKVEIMQNRRRGALIGLAVGDALGAAVEFKAPGSFPPVTDYRDGGPHRLNPGEWTDDTSMALALADSLATVGWDLNDQADRYVQWWQTGQYSVNGECFDIGIATATALQNYVDTGTHALLGAARNGPVAMARSCGWLRCQSDLASCTSISWLSFPDWPRNPV